MGQARSNPKRRRQPRRRPIPPSASAAARISQGPLPQALPSPILLPGTDLLVHLVTAPVPVAPLYAILTAIHQAVGDCPTSRAVLESAQVVRALRWLGFEAELIACCARVFCDPYPARLTDVGVRNRPPAVRADGTTDGHTIVWISSANRFFDLAVFRDRNLLRAEGGEDPTFNVPAMLPMPGGRAQLLNPLLVPATDRGRWRIAWYLYPHWTSRYDELIARHADAVNSGGLALAQVTLDLLSATAVHRDMTELDRLYPQLGRLLSGAAQLPGARVEEGAVR